MTRVWLSLGSNIERDRNIGGALQTLSGQFGKLVLSRVYECEAVGFAGDPFYNLVAGLETELPPSELVLAMRAIEEAHGRRRGSDKFAPRSLDIDLLTYGDRVIHEGGLHLPRDEILKYAFVLGPLAEVAGDELHPVTGTSYRQLWADFDQNAHPMQPVELSIGC